MLARELFHTIGKVSYLHLSSLKEPKRDLSKASFFHNFETIPKLAQTSFFSVLTKFREEK